MKKFLKDFNLVGFLMLTMCVLLGIGDMAGAVMSADAPTIPATETSPANPNNPNDPNGGTTTSAGERSALATWDYRTWSDGLIKDPVEKEVIRIRSYATPFDSILSYIGSEKINNLKYKYWQIEDREQKVEVLKFDRGSGNTDKARVVGTLYIDGNYSAAINKNDNLLVEGDGDYAGNELYLYVLGVEYNKTVTKGSGGSAVTKNATAIYVTADEDQVVDTSATSTPAYKIPAINGWVDVDGSTVTAAKNVYLCGRAHNELDTTSPDLEFLPKEKYGYAQIFKTEITLSNYAIMADKEVKWDLSEIEQEAMYDWKKAKERAFLFGKMSKIYTADGKEVFRTGGAFRETLKNQNYQPIIVHGGVTTKDAADAEFIDMMESIYVGNNGSPERFAFAGSKAINRLTKMMAKGVSKQQDAVKTETVQGITWSKIVSNYGTLNVIHHPLFNESPYSEYMFVFDPQFIRKKEVLPVDRQEVDGKEHLIVNGKIVIFSETSGVALYNPNVHKVLKITNTAS